MQYRFDSKMDVFHCYTLQHFQIITISVIMSIILSLILSNLFTWRSLMSGTRNVYNTSVCVCNFNICDNRYHLASHDLNLNINIQGVCVSSCSRPRSDSCFHNLVNGVKSSKTICDLFVKIQQQILVDTAPMNL